MQRTVKKSFFQTFSVQTTQYLSIPTIAIEFLFSHPTKKLFILVLYVLSFQIQQELTCFSKKPSIQILSIILINSFSFFGSLFHCLLDSLMAE